MPNLFDIKVVYSDFWEILKFLPVTLRLAGIAMVLGLVLGFVIAIIRIRKIPVLRQVTDVFISIIRGTPILVQLYVTYFGIPILLKYINYWNGTDFRVTLVPPIVYAIAALVLNQSAFYSVTIQSALQAVNKGEVEAAMALGMSGPQRMFRIIIPEAIELALPSLGNTIINLVKGTSLAFTCSVVEMTAQGKIIAGGNFRYFESYVALAIIYWLVTIVIERLINLVLKITSISEEPKGANGKKSWRDLFKKSAESVTVTGVGA
ncbi:MAG: amino acid ABC transporter permease [Treponema sp.]|nr:amino acid ABC transporter permease [Treponema sp.]